MQKNAVHRFFFVCAASARGGVYKRIHETKEFINFAEENEDFSNRSGEIIKMRLRELETFFIDVACTAIPTALSEDMDIFSDNMIEKIIRIYGDNPPEDILYHIKNNRKILHILKDRNILHHYNWLNGWIENNEVFFLDMLNALKGIFPFSVEELQLSWPGKPCLMRLIPFDTGKFEEFMGVLLRAKDWKSPGSVLQKPDCSGDAVCQM